MRIIIEIDDKEKGTPEIVSAVSTAGGRRSVDIYTPQPNEEETGTIEAISAGPAAPVTDSNEEPAVRAEPFPQEGGSAGAAPDLDVPMGETCSASPEAPIDAKSAGTAPEFEE